MEPDQDNVIIIKLNHHQKTKKTEKPPPAKKNETGEEEDFFLYCVTFTWPVNFIFSTEENPDTVSPIPSPLSSASPPAAVSWIPPVLCHLYLASKLYSATEEDDFQLCHL